VPEALSDSPSTPTFYWGEFHLQYRPTMAMDSKARLPLYIAMITVWMSLDGDLNEKLLELDGRYI
jgi:hypothetical protein